MWKEVEEILFDGNIFTVKERWAESEGQSFGGRGRSETSPHIFIRGQTGTNQKAVEQCHSLTDFCLEQKAGV